MPGTVRLHRILLAEPDRVYRAFLEPGAYASWFPPDGFYAIVHSMEAKVGGKFRMTFTNFAEGFSHDFEGTYVDLDPGKRLVYTTVFDDEQFEGEVTTVVDLQPCSFGTEISIEQSNLPGMIPVDACTHGWQECLRKLASLVEHNIPA